MAKASRPIIAAVDLFCGAGGLTKGLEDAGIEVRLGVDLDPACSYPYEENTGARFLPKSVEQLTARELNRAFANAPFRLLAGCAPCQPFSTYSQAWTSTSDHRWGLLEHFGCLVEETKPEFVTMENVPRLQHKKIFKDFVALLKRLDFDVEYKTVNCAGFGVPQHRERLVLLASRLGPVTLRPPSRSRDEYRTVKQAIGGMPSLTAGDVDEDDPLHMAAELSETNLKRIKASKPGGTWRDWNADLVAKCHKKRTGRTYPSVYGRMRWSEPSPTVTTQFFGFGNGRFGHPKQNRALSLREGAVLQGFPRDYEFVRRGDPIHCKTVGRLIGNAVPVKLARAIGRSFRQHVEQIS